VTTKRIGKSILEKTLTRWPVFVDHFNTAYQINLLDKSDYVLAHGLNTDDQLAFGIVYQF
ncbi:hypothetical protein C9Z74_14965, partial [Escherichia coli]